MNREKVEYIREVLYTIKDTSKHNTLLTKLVQVGKIFEELIAILHRVS